MGDADHGPSKKRAAGREISRDNPDLDDEDFSQEETGTFKRASEDVLATRRIVKVRRKQTTSVSAPNPFVGICLVPPTESKVNSAETTSEVQSVSEKKIADDEKVGEDAEQISKEAKEADKLQLELKTVASTDNSVAEKDSPEKDKVTADMVTSASKETEDKLPTLEMGLVDDDPIIGKETSGEVNADKETADCVNDGVAVRSGIDNEVYGAENDNKNKNEAQTKEQSSEASTLSSFQHLSSTQNAFTGIAGTGFSSSSFSFASVSSSSIFGLKDKQLGLGLSSNGSSSLFNSSVPATVSKCEGSSFPALQEVPVETGEENEKTIFSAESVLFEFVDNGWKERGKGEVKVNVSTCGTETARLLMRTRGNYRLILNARLYADMKLTDMDKRGITFACVNSATEGKASLSTFALKFKDAAILAEFRAAVMEHKSNAKTVSKTPENSPDASKD